MENRITAHPILEIKQGKAVPFTFNGVEMRGVEGETIIAALHANGVRTLQESLNKHRKRGLFCAIGNCSSCLMKVNGLPNVRVCIEPLQAGMAVETQHGRQDFNVKGARERADLPDLRTYETDVLVLGGGPAGMCAAIEAAEHNAKVIIVERNPLLGGQLIKQTHKFFGSEQQQAGTRGNMIAAELHDRISSFGLIDLWLNSTAVGYYPDGMVMVEKGAVCVGVKAKSIVVATGAAEKTLIFPNNDLPGIYGAGAVQTLMNVALIKPGATVLMVGAGNIGLIVSYQLLQAGVNVAAVLEAAPQFGGYEVHALKLRRAGVPILTGHTVKYAYGQDSLEGAVIHRLDERWQPIPGTEQDVKADIMCLAVGLSPLADLFFQAGCKIRYVAELGGYVPVADRQQRTSIPGIYAAGDAGGIEEASSAMLTGKIAGLQAVHDATPLGDYQERFEDYGSQLDLLRFGPHAEKIRRGLEKLHQGEGVGDGKC